MRIRNICAGLGLVALLVSGCCHCHRPAPVACGAPPCPGPACGGAPVVAPPPPVAAPVQSYSVPAAPAYH
jgi:hypothetical protein